VSGFCAPKREARTRASLAGVPVPGRTDGRMSRAIRGDFRLGVPEIHSVRRRRQGPPTERLVPTPFDALDGWGLPAAGDANAYLSLSRAHARARPGTYALGGLSEGGLVAQARLSFEAHVRFVSDHTDERWPTATTPIARIPRVSWPQTTRDPIRRSQDRTVTPEVAGFEPRPSRRIKPWKQPYGVAFSGVS
jgi:hypothetical protein